MSRLILITTFFALTHYAIADWQEEIRKLVTEADPTLANRTPTIDFALELGKFVAVRTRNTTPDPRFPRVSRVENLRLILNDPTYGHECSGYAVTLMDILQAFGIPARLVQLYGREKHASLEAQFEGEYVVIDATFNVIFREKDGKLISYRRIFEILRETGAMPAHEYIGGGTPRRIEDYYIPYVDLLVKGRALPVFMRKFPGIAFIYPGEERYYRVNPVSAVYFEELKKE